MESFPLKRYKLSDGEQKEYILINKPAWSLIGINKTVDSIFPKNAEFKFAYYIVAFAR
jgi:hypothetical protein